MKYAIKVKMLSGTWVRTLSFLFDGVHITFTKDPSEAARVSVRGAADGIAAAVPTGRVVEVDE